MKWSKKYHHLALGLVCLAAAVVLRANLVFAAATISSDIYDSHGTFRLGTLSYTKTDGEKPLTGGASVLNYEYSRFFRMNQALVLGFRQATDAASKRDAYHAAYGGYRIFPLGIGFPILTNMDDSSLLIDSKYKPYAEASLGLGRMLYDAFDQNAAAELASDTMSFAFGGGLMMHFFTRWALELQIMYEIVQARGGTGNSLSLSGSNMYILLGSGVLF